MRQELSPLRPAQVGTSHTNNFNLLRILAATQVLLFHSFARLHVQVPAWLEPLHLFPGVPIFFVLSGFLVSASFERNRSNLLGYFRNRAIRIFPGLWCCLVLTVLTFYAFGFHPGFRQLLTWFVLQCVGLIYTPHFLSTFGSATYNGSLWTIPLELQFYMVLPVLYWMGSKFRKPRAFMLFAFVFFLIVAAVLIHWIPSTVDPGPNEGILQKLLRYTFVPRFYLFVLGIVLQQFALQKHRFLAGKGALWLVAYAIAAVFLHGAAGEVVTMVMLGLTAISLAYTFPRVSEHVLGGLDISYGVYIYHGLILNILVQRALVGRGRDVLIVLAASIVVGTVSWLCLEKPALQRKKAQTSSTTSSLPKSVASV